MNFDWKWNLADLNPDKDVSVFSTFSCGGGSTMGYKKAGFRVLGNVEIDSRMNEIYKRNHHPKFNYNMDLRKFNEIPKEDLPEELFRLDVLDGSPPCSTFSLAGSREDAWGKMKKFREGQAEQTLDDLFFVFLDTVEKLNPRIVVAENVAGLLMGNAKGYVNLILKRFRELGYEVQLFKLNSARMDVPQSRERSFFVANRCGFPKLVLRFQEPVIRFGEVRTKEPGDQIPAGSRAKLDLVKYGDLDLGEVTKRAKGKATSFSHKLVWDERVCQTITAKSMYVRACDMTRLTDRDFVNASTFPQDYDFGEEPVQYVCGMSVPPNMMAHVAEEIWEQWLK